MPKRGKTELSSECSDIIRGLKGALSAIPEFVLGKQTYTNAELVVAFQRLIDAQRTTTSAHGGWREAVLAERKVQKDVAALRRLYKSFVESRFGLTPGATDVGGFPRTEPKKPDVVTKAAAVEKRRAIHEAKKAALESVEGNKKTKKK